MIYSSLINDINEAFSSFKKPSIIYAAPASEDISKGEYLVIQQDYCSILRDEMTYEQCSMMIIDGQLISDEALCYFIPRLARAVFQENGNQFLLYRRLENLNKNFLSQEKKYCWNCLLAVSKSLNKK